MKKLGMLLGRSSRKEKTLLYISYILNVFLIATIIMVVYALRESIAGLSGTDSDQAGMMSAAMILVVVIIVVFFLWLIAMELKSLYDSRMQFNTNVRLTGFSNWKLTMLYLTELLYMQPVSVAAGIVLGELVYHLYAVRAGEILLWIQPQVLAGALALHLGMLLATVLLIGLKQGKHSAASELRGTKMHKKKKLPGVIAQAGVSVGVILAVHFSCVGFQRMLDPATALMGCQAMKLLYYVAVIFAFDPVMLLIFRMAEGIGRLTGAYHFRLALKLQASFWGRFKIMCFLFLFSGSLFCGLYSLYATGRLVGGSLAENNIHYQSYSLYDDTLQIREAGGMQETASEFQTLRYRAHSEDGSGIWVTGIDGGYLRLYETLLEVPGMDETEGYTQEDVRNPADLAEDAYLTERLEDADFDGIILQEDRFGAKKGDLLTLNFNGTDVTFTVYTGILSNDWGRADAYVSRADLEKQLGMEGCYNITFYLNRAENVDTEGAVISQTKEELCLESYTQAVKSTENIELVVWMILICSVMAVGTCLVMSCGDNRSMLACLQGMGTPRGSLIKIFLIQAVWNVLWVTVPVIAMTHVLTRALGYLVANPANFSVTGFEISPWRFALLFAAWFAVYLAVQLFLVRRETKDGRCVEILRK